MRKLEALILIIALASFVITSYGATAYIVKTYNILMQGNVYCVGIEAFWDSTCTNKCDSIDWGWCQPGENKNVTIYLRNTGNTPVILTLSTQDWSPAEAENYITLTWDREGYNMTEQVVACTFILAVDSSIQNTTIQTFTFTAVITATQT